MTQCLLAAGGTHDVKISHVENGAKTFYVQLTSNLELIGELSKRMQNSRQQPSMILEGTVYLVRQGRLVYRGLLVSVDPLRARLIDFGNIVDADYKDLCQLPAPFDKFGQMAYRFSLAGVCGNPQLSFNPDAVERFKSLAKATHQFQLKVVSADGPPTSQYCELYKNNVSILTTLEDELSKMVVNYEKRQFLQTNIEHTVFVSFVETKTQTLPWTFFVQMASEKSRLQTLSSELMQFCSSVGAANADQLVQDSPVLAKFNDQWYRGLLLQKVAHGCSVYFVDHGNTEIVPLENLRMPPSLLANYMPEQAIKCILDGCSSNLDARDIMEKLIHPKEYLLTVVFELKNNTANVRLKEKESDFYLNDQIIAKLWANKNHAPVEQITWHAKPSMEILAPSKKDNVARQVDLPPKRPDKELYSPPNIKLRNDFISTDFFAEEANRNSEGRQHPDFDVPDRSNHKRFWASSDDWGSFRSGQDQSWMSVDDRFENEKGSTGSGKFKSSFIWTRGSDFLNSRDKRSQNSNHQPNGRSDNNSAGFVIRKLSPKIQAFPIKIGEQLPAMIVFMTSPNDFFIQPLAMYTKLEEMTAAVTTEFNENNWLLSEIFEGDFCWAKYPLDSLWYRARVLSKVGENCWKVSFVDYGNTSEVSIADMRLLKEEHANVPALSINCLLRGCGKSNWPEEEVDKFEATTKFDFDVTIVAKLKDKFSVVLHRESECLNTQMGASNESLLPLNKTKLQTLEVGSTLSNVTLSWFFNPKCIIMHRIENCSILSKTDLKKELLPSLPIVNPEIGTLVHIEVDKKLLRGSIVAAKNGKKFKVQLVDYGRIMICNLEDLNALPEEFAAYPRQAIACSINDVEPANGKSWPTNRSELLPIEDIFKSYKTFTINVKSVQDDGILDVDMTTAGGENVAELLRRRGFAAPLQVETKTPIERALPNTDWKVFVSVFVSVFDSHTKFFVQKEFHQTQLQEMQQKLQDVTGPALTEFAVGQKILARSEDGLWYRGCIVKSESPIEVVMMDYGDMQAVMETKALPQEFASIPPFATCCCMPMAATPNRHAELQAEVEAELCVVRRMTMHIIAEAAKEYLVVDFISEQSSLIEDKITKGLATSTFFEGYVSNVTSLEGVDVQNALWTDKLEAMSTSLERAESFPPLEKFQVGARCVAKFEDDGVFYRAQITSLKDSAVKVYFDDYGNSALVTDVRQAPDEILQVHHLSQLVKVCNPPPSEEVRDRMLMMLSDGSCKFHFLMLNSTSFPLEVVIFKNGVDLRNLAAPDLNTTAVEFSPLPMVMKVGVAEKLEVCNNVLKRPHHQEADESINVPAKRAPLSSPETAGKHNQERNRLI